MRCPCHSAAIGTALSTEPDTTSAALSFRVDRGFALPRNLCAGEQRDRRVALPVSAPCSKDNRVLTFHELRNHLGSRSQFALHRREPLQLLRLGTFRFAI